MLNLSPDLLVSTITINYQHTLYQVKKNKWLPKSKHPIVFFHQDNFQILFRHSKLCLGLRQNKNAYNLSAKQHSAEYQLHTAHVIWYFG